MDHLDKIRRKTIRKHQFKKWKNNYVIQALLIITVILLIVLLFLQLLH
jgi:hypothetical protein